MYNNKDIKKIVNKLKSTKEVLNLLGEEFEEEKNFIIDLISFNMKNAI